MAKSTTELLTRLAEHSEFCDANEWELPISMGDDIREAMELIMTLTGATPEQPPFDRWGQWEFVGYDMSHGSAHVIWGCKKCGYRRLSSWEAPGYGCPECTGRTNKEATNAETTSE